MSAERLVAAETAVDSEATPQRYLRSVLAVVRAGRHGEWAVVHFGSGLFFRTDRLGALAVLALIDGRSDADAVEAVRRIEAGAGARAWQLIDTLGLTGALTVTRPRIADVRWRIRRGVAHAAGKVLTLLSPLVRLGPISVLAWTFRVMPVTPVGGHIWRSRSLAILANLRASGYSGRPESWLRRVGRDSAACAPSNDLFMFISESLSAERLDLLVDRLFDGDSVDGLANRLRAAGPSIGVFLHGPVCVAVPNALRRRGIDVVRTVNARWHGTNVSVRSGRLSGFFGDSAAMTVEIGDPLAMAALVRHLQSGRSVHIALDRAATGKEAARVAMLGDQFARNDVPAWLAVRSGRPLSLWTTYRSASRFAVDASPLLHPDPSLPIALRVADLSERLYRYAEEAVSRHPEGWACWSYLHSVKGGGR